MSFTEQRISTEQEAWLSLSRGFKESAIMDWIMSNTKRFCEMVAVQKDFPFVLTPKVSDTGKNVESEKCSPGQAPILDKEREMAFLSFTQLKRFHFNDVSVSLHGGSNVTSWAIITMFKLSGVFEYFGMDEEILLNWLSVVKGSCDKYAHPYHNWTRAFCTTQTVFYLISSFNLSGILTCTDKLVMLMVALCHGMCHLNQTTNAANSRVSDSLLELYSTHWDDFTCMECLTGTLNDRNNCNILDFLERGEEIEVLDEVSTTLDAADFSLLFEKVNELKDLVQKGEFTFDDPKHRVLFRSLAVSACCLAWLGKSWDMHVKMSEAIVLGLEGNENANKWFTERQCDLFNTVLPLFEVLCMVDDSFKELREGVLSNRDIWSDVLGQDVDCPSLVADDCTSDNNLPSPHTDIRFHQPRGGTTEMNGALRSLMFDDLSLSDKDTLSMSLDFFECCGLARQFNMNGETLLNWLIVVKDGCSYAHPFHNWRRAFGVAHSVFALISSDSLSQHLTPVDKLVMLVAALSHKLCFTTEAHTVLSKSTQSTGSLFPLCSTPWSETDHMRCFLNTITDHQECNILEGLSLGCDECEVLDMIKTSMAATDLSSMAVRIKQFTNSDFVYQDDICWTSREHRDLIRSVVMTAGCLCWVAKPWDIHRKMGESVLESMSLSELMGQRDQSLEIKEGDFLMTIHFFQAFSMIFDDFHELYQGAVHNRYKWLRVITNCKGRKKCVKFNVVDDEVKEEVEVFNDGHKEFDIEPQSERDIISSECEKDGATTSNLNDIVEMPPTLQDAPDQLRGAAPPDEMEGEKLSTVDMDVSTLSQREFEQVSLDELVDTEVKEEEEVALSDSEERDTGQNELLVPLEQLVVVGVEEEEVAIPNKEEREDGKNEIDQVPSESVSPVKKKRSYLKRLRKMLRKLFHLKKGSS